MYIYFVSNGRTFTSFITLESLFTGYIIKLAVLFLFNTFLNDINDKVQLYLILIATKFSTINLVFLKVYKGGNGGRRRGREIEGGR